MRRVLETQQGDGSMGVAQEAHRVLEDLEGAVTVLRPLDVLEAFRRIERAVGDAAVLRRGGVGQPRQPAQVIGAEPGARVYSTAARAASLKARVSSSPVHAAS